MYQSNTAVSYFSTTSLRSQPDVKSCNKSPTLPTITIPVSKEQILRITSDNKKDITHDKYIIKVYSPIGKIVRSINNKPSHTIRSISRMTVNINNLPSSEKCHKNSGKANSNLKLCDSGNNLVRCSLAPRCISGEYTKQDLQLIKSCNIRLSPCYMCKTSKYNQVNHTCY